MLEWLQKWYEVQCDGNWEHYHGIKIETLDNPGWSVEIDFNDTNYKIKNLNWKLYELKDNNWIGFKIENNIFYGSGDPLKLTLILKIFKYLIANENTNDHFIMQEMV